ncbi:class I SAM-dependent methyltransferase [Fulvivirga lutimaris]|uniref:class I SAM-dependent methyltransferase n=1 Tax=Fulvivirga lutimaris TaxID=1819566 RepID=UPI0012BC4903|nr:class I SAM-dependent methyltransferase [Fulvivirga lutimaris]MTI40165.1 methyltransferase domain-containing protein [Fulvivirga lutimaris]
MNTELIQIRDNQRNSWNSFSGGWNKWDDFTMRFLKEQGQCIIDELSLKPTDKVLDIASGTGEPGLTIAATIRNGGSVIATDLSEQMLEIAEVKASAMALDNFSVEVADACELPFEDNTFDAISCRLGFMFFPDMQLAAREMMRVLKPGGVLVTTVWAEPEKNAWITTIMGALKKHLDLPAPEPQKPGLFRCAAGGFLTSLFSELGFSGATEKTIAGIMNCDSADEYWNFMNDVVPPVVSALKNTSQQIQNQIKQDVINVFEDKAAKAMAQTPYAARLFTVRKPNQ